MNFLRESLGLELHAKNDKIIKARHGLRFLGVIIWPRGRKLNARSIGRIHTNMDEKNIASYRGLLLKHMPQKKKEFYWTLYERFLSEIC